MRQWRDCKTTQERHAAIVEAMAVARGVKKDAAKLLGLNRQYFQGLYKKLLAGSDTVARVASSDTVASRDTRDTKDRVASVGTVVPSIGRSLTSGRREPTLPHMDAVADQTVGIENLSIQVPKRVKDWLERQALERKQRTGGRFAVSPIIVELIERAMVEPAAPPSPKKRGRDQKGGAE